MFRNSITRHMSSACAFAASTEGGAAAPAPAKPKASVPAAGKSPFAHLARNAPRAAESDDDENKDENAAAEDEGEEDDEDDEKKDDKAKKSKKAKKAKRAKKAEGDDEDDADASEDEECEDDEDMAEDGDDDSDKDDDADAKARAARARERGRIRAIVTSDAGKLNPLGAMELACGTSMTRKHAIGVLKAMGAPNVSAPSKPADALRSRMAGVEAPDVGADAPSTANASPVKATAQAIVNAGKKRRGETIT